MSIYGQVKKAAPRTGHREGGLLACACCDRERILGCRQWFRPGGGSGSAGWASTL